MGVLNKTILTITYIITHGRNFGIIIKNLNYDVYCNSHIIYIFYFIVLTKTIIDWVLYILLRGFIMCSEQNFATLPHPGSTCRGMKGTLFAEASNVSPILCHIISKNININKHNHRIFFFNFINYVLPTL